LAARGSIERSFSRVAERRMAEIVGEAERFRQILIEPQLAANRAGDLRHFKTVRQSRAVMVAFVEQEHLRLVGQPPEGAGVQDAVPVTLEGGARRACRLIDMAPAAGDR
jgi:hypothetical protein